MGDPMLHGYHLTIEDYQQFRVPEFMRETHYIKAHSAADAIIMGQLKYRFPIETEQFDGTVDTWGKRSRRLINIEAD